MATIPLGTSHELKLLVTGDVAISFMGLESARVLSTPNVVRNMEIACLYALKPYLDEGYESVGTLVNVRHLAGAPIGMSVVFRGEVTGVDGRRVSFKVEAFDEVEKIAEGTHERFIVNAERFGKRVQEKAARR